MIKGIYEKPTVNIQLNNERMKDYSLRSGKRQDICFHYWHLTLHWKFYLEKSNKKENKRQRKTGKEKIKLALFTDDMIFHMEYPKEHTHTNMDIINEFSKVGGYKINAWKLIIVFYRRNEKS